MARYIDADKLIEFITKGLNNPDKTKAFGYDAIEILTEIEYAATADVAPKSEVARAFRQRMNEKMGKHTHLLGKEYVQRIMREIEKEFTEGGGQNELHALRTPASRN